MGATLTVVQGTVRDTLLQIRDSSGNAYAPITNPSPFLSTDTLAFTVWPGDTLAALATPTVTWSDVTTATVQVSFVASDTTTLSAGLYRWQLTATRASRTGVLDQGRLNVQAAPGTGTTDLAFTVLNDLLKYAPWIEDIQADTDQWAFSEEQARATNRLIDALVNQYPSSTYSPQAGQPGFNAFSLGMSSGGTAGWWLRQQLIPLTPGGTIPATYPDRTNTTANKIRSTVSTALLLYDEVLEICAKWALSYALQAQISRNSDKDWWQLYRMFKSDADSLFRARRFEIDLSVPQTGYASITIHGGGGSLR